MESPQSTLSMLELAEQVAAAATSIAQRLKEKSLAEPTFHPPSARLPNDPEILEARRQLLIASRALSVLSHDPWSHLQEIIFQYNDSSAIGLMVDWRIAHVLSIDGTAMHISEIAKRSGADEHKLVSAFRMLTLKYIFIEVKPDYFAHSSSSVFLTNPETEQLVSHVIDVLVPSTFRVSEAMRKWPSSVLPNETGFSLGHNTTKEFFPWLLEHPEKHERFNKMTKSVAQLSYRRLREVYPWKSLGKATVVDVAGGNGHITQQIAYEAPELSFILQDLEPTIIEAKRSFPDDLKDRFEFMVIDFFEEQKVQADVYFLRMILHFMNDTDCVKVLKAIVPAMKKGSRILIAEGIVPGYSATPKPWNQYGFMNWAMISLLNAKERTLIEYEKLFAEVDPRFKLKQWGEAGGPPASEIIEATLD